MNKTELKKILFLHALWTNDDPKGERANLTDANLKGFNLKGVSLTNADLADADLTDANLWGADLWGADLTNADLTNADLTGAILAAADLTNADLTGADLGGVRHSEEKEEYRVVTCEDEGGPFSKNEALEEIQSYLDNGYTINQIKLLKVAEVPFGVQIKCVTKITIDE